MIIYNLWLITKFPTGETEHINIITTIVKLLNNHY
jgi:hypothetical protein